MPELLNQINNHINFFKESSYKDESLKNKVFTQIEIINQKLCPKRIELTALLNRIVEKESKITRRISKELLINDSLDLSYSSNDTAYLDTNYKNRGHKASFDSNKLIIKDVQENLNYLKKREEELEEIKKVSGQIRELSDNMVTNIQTQGDNLNIINIDLIEAKENSKKTEKEIEIAERESKSLMNRTLCFILLICFVVTSFISIGVLLFFGKNKN
jgi:hypothetical protein